METTLEQIASTVEQRFELTRSVFRDQISLIVPPEKVVGVARTLRDEFGFTFLSDESAIDYWPEEEPRFHIAYMLRTMRAPYLLITLRAPLSGAESHIETMVNVYPNANWFEREIWDLFGIYFDGHPDMRRILMPYDWEGHPLRKDYPLGYETIEFNFNVTEVESRKPRPKD